MKARCNIGHPLWHTILDDHFVLQVKERHLGSKHTSYIMEVITLLPFSIAGKLVCPSENVVLSHTCLEVATNVITYLHESMLWHFGLHSMRSLVARP